MARPDDFRRTASDVPNTQRLQNLIHFKSAKAQTTSPTFQQLLRLEDSNFSQKQKKNHDQEDDGNRHNKKSVLAKVKDKAKKLKYSLSGKKHRDGNESRAPSTASEDDHASSSITEARFKNQTPLDTSVVADSKNQVPTTTDVLKVQDSPESDSRFSGPTVSTQESGASKSGKSVEEEMKTRDKGVSVKEYLMHKFEPGEDERALSQVITQTISPRRDKMREAMNSFLKNDDPTESTSKLSNSEASSSTVAKDVSFSPSHSLGKSNASSNLNQIFKSTVASYQNHNLGLSPNHNTSLNSMASSSGQNTNTGAKPSSSPLGLGHGSSASETRAPVHTNRDATQVPKSSPNQTRVPLSMANRTRVPATGNIREVIEENRGRILRAN